MTHLSLLLLLCNPFPLATETHENTLCDARLGSPGGDVKL